MDPNHEESHHPFDPSTERSISSVNVVGRCLAAPPSSKYQHPNAHSLYPSIGHHSLKSFPLDNDIQDSHCSNIQLDKKLKHMIENVLCYDPEVEQDLTFMSLFR